MFTVDVKQQHNNNCEQKIFSLVTFRIFFFFKLIQTIYLSQRWNFFYSENLTKYDPKWHCCILAAHLQKLDFFISIWEWNWEFNRPDVISLFGLWANLYILLYFLFSNIYNCIPIVYIYFENNSYLNLKIVPLFRRKRKSKLSLEILY